MNLGLADFAGRWRIARQITDHRTGQTARFAGEALLAPTDTGLSYAEDGTLSLPRAAPMRATRRYLWRQAAGGRIVVDHADGGAFHEFDPATGAASEHLCGQDTYQVAYDLAGWPDWQAVWEVRGPSKDYRLVSRYLRCGI